MENVMVCVNRVIPLPSELIQANDIGEKVPIVGFTLIATCG